MKVENSAVDSEKEQVLRRQRGFRSEEHASCCHQAHCLSRRRVWATGSKQAHVLSRKRNFGTEPVLSSE